MEEGAEAVEEDSIAEEYDGDDEGDDCKIQGGDGDGEATIRNYCYRSSSGR